MRKWLIAILLTVLIIAVSIIPLYPFQLASTYVTAYEGAKAAYYGIYYNNTQYTNTQKYNASLCRFDTILQFDPDQRDIYMCNLIGETTSIFIPKVDVAPPWVPWEWSHTTIDWKNPVDTYEWQITDSAGNIHYYRMEEWNTVWYISISAEWDSGPDFWRTDDEAQNRYYHGTEVWFEFDLQPVWYFEGAQSAYFAIAKIELYNVKLSGRDAQGNYVPPREGISFAPASPTTPLTIYLYPFGNEPAPDTNQLMQYRGVALNPQYFRDKVYSYIALEDFGTHDWYNPPFAMGAQGDVVTLMFKVTQFVVGEWVVKDVRQLPNEYGRMAKTGTTGWDIGKALADIGKALTEWLSNPLNQLWLFFIIIVIVIIIITVLNPGVWAALLTALRRNG